MLRAHALPSSPSPSRAPGGGRTNAANTNANKLGLRKANVNANGAIPSDQRTLEANDYYFTKVGYGACLDSNDSTYSSIAYLNGLANVVINTLDDCAQQCTSCLGQGEDSAVFRGFYFATNAHYWACYCYFEVEDADDDTPIPSCESAGPNGGSPAFLSPGTGEIDRSTGDGTSGECWTVADRPEPSSEPSSQPSSVPSSEPSSQPSSVPSSEPSSTPSCTPSAAPTEAPSRSDKVVYLFYPEWTEDGCR